MNADEWAAWNAWSRYIKSQPWQRADRPEVSARGSAPVLSAPVPAGPLAESSRRPPKRKR